MKILFVKWERCIHLEKIIDSIIIEAQIGIPRKGKDQREWELIISHIIWVELDDGNYFFIPDLVYHLSEYL